MMRIRFQGKIYLFTGDSLEDDGAIATDEQFKNGECSYAHLFEDGRILRLRKQIGIRADVEVLETGLRVEPDDYGRAILNMFKSKTWSV